MSKSDKDLLCDQEEQLSTEARALYQSVFGTLAERQETEANLKYGNVGDTDDDSEGYESSSKSGCTNVVKNVPSYTNQEEQLSTAARALYESMFGTLAERQEIEANIKYGNVGDTDDDSEGYESSSGCGSASVVKNVPFDTNQEKRRQKLRELLYARSEANNKDCDAGTPIRAYNNSCIRTHISVRCTQHNPPTL